MKNLLILIIIAFAIPMMVFSQKNPEFSLELSSNTIELRPGETKTIEVKIVRSKGFQKYTAKFGFSSSTPEGITLKYQTADGVISENTITISADANAKADSHMLLPNCVLNNKTKSAVLKLIVTNDAAATRGE